MLSDVLHTVAKLQASLQARELDLASAPVLVDGTICRLRELKENPPSSMRFKDHNNVFTDSNLLGERHIVVPDGQEEQLSCVFIVHTYKVLLFHLDLGPATLFLHFLFLILGTYRTRKRS